MPCKKEGSLGPLSSTSQWSLGFTILGAGGRTALLCTHDSPWPVLPYTEERKSCPRRPNYGSSIAMVVKVLTGICVLAGKRRHNQIRMI